MLYYVICYIMLYVILCYMLYYVICYIMLYVILCYMLYYVICYIMLFVILCYMLYYVICYIMLYCSCFDTWIVNMLFVSLIVCIYLVRFLNILHCLYEIVSLFHSFFLIYTFIADIKDYIPYKYYNNFYYNNSIQ